MITAWRTREELAHRITLLAKQGETRRPIARALGVSRNTVRKRLDAHAAGRQDVAQIAVVPRSLRAPRPSKLDAWRPRVAALIAKYADIWNVFAAPGRVDVTTSEIRVRISPAANRSEHAAIRRLLAGITAEAHAAG